MDECYIILRYGPYKLNNLFPLDWYLRTCNSVDLLRSNLGRNDLAVAQKMVADQSLLSAREVHRSSAGTQVGNRKKIEFNSLVKIFFLLTIC